MTRKSRALQEAEAALAAAAERERELSARVAQLEEILPEAKPLTRQEIAGRQADVGYLRELARQGRTDEVEAFARHMTDRPPMAIEMEGPADGMPDDSLKMEFYARELRQRAYVNWYNSPEGGPNHRTPECLKPDSTVPVTEIPRQWLDGADASYVVRLVQWQRERAAMMDESDALTETLNAVSRANRNLPPKPPEMAAKPPRRITAKEVAQIHKAQLQHGGPLLEVDWDQVAVD